MPELPEPPSIEDDLFSTQEDWWNNARINWSPSTWDLYASGFKEAADTLVDKVEKRELTQDTIVYPTLFLYRQYIELKLKIVIQALRKLQGVGSEFPKGHNIANLWTDAEKLIIKNFPENSKTALIETGRLIQEFSNVDPKSTAFRYPVDNSGDPSLPGMTHINLRNVRDVMAKIAMLLNGTYMMTEGHLQLHSEMKHESREDWH